MLTHDPLYHIRMMRLCERHSNIFGQEWHLRKLIDHAPDHLEWRSRHMFTLLRLGRDRDAWDAFIQALRIQFVTRPELLTKPE